MPALYLFISLCTNATPRQNRACPEQRLVALTPEMQISTEVIHVALIAIRTAAATQPFCSTMPTATLWFHMMAKGYEQGRIRTEIHFFLI